MEEGSPSSQPYEETIKDAEEGEGDDCEMKLMEYRESEVTDESERGFCADSAVELGVEPSGELLVQVESEGGSPSSNVLSVVSDLMGPTEVDTQTSFVGPREPLGADRGDDRFGESVPEMSTDTRIYESKSLVSVPLMDSTQRMASMKMRAHTEWTTDEVEKTNIFSFWMIHNMKPSIEKETKELSATIISKKDVNGWIYMTVEVNHLRFFFLQIHKFHLNFFSH